MTRFYNICYRCGHELAPDRRMLGRALIVLAIVTVVAVMLAWTMLGMSEFVVCYVRLLLGGVCIAEMPF